MGRRRVFSREFKTEAVRLVVERGVSVARAAKDLGVHENVLGKWVRNFKADPEQSFPGRGKMKPDDAEVAQLPPDLAKTRTERDILKQAIAYFAKEPR